MTKLRCDLHSHSTASDGTRQPAEVVHEAYAAGVDVLALTDHDTTEGVHAAQVAAAEVGMHFVPGVEISVTWNHQVIHIVGLGIDAVNAELAQGLSGLRDYRAWRAQEIGRRLAKCGIGDAYEGAWRLAAGSSIGRTHFARYLLAQGHVEELQQAFNRYLSRGKPGYVPGQWASLTEAVRWICAAGGEAVIAHPARYKLSGMNLRRLLSEFKEVGGSGVELVSGSFPQHGISSLVEYVRRFDLLASAGSDYHGPGQVANRLGQLPEIPANCRPIWETWPLPSLGARAIPVP